MLIRFIYSVHLIEVWLSCFCAAATQLLLISDIDIIYWSFYLCSSDFAIYVTGRIIKNYLLTFILWGKRDDIHLPIPVLPSDGQTMVLG